MYYTCILSIMIEMQLNISVNESCYETNKNASLCIPAFHSPGYCITWDKIERQNKMMLWALAYGAVNRIPTTHLSDSCVNAADIPLQKFLPMEEDITEIKKRMEIIVARIIQKNMPYFHSCTVVSHIRHSFWRESSKKSKVVSSLLKCQVINILQSTNT